MGEARLCGCIIPRRAECVEAGLPEGCYFREGAPPDPGLGWLRRRLKGWHERERGRRGASFRQYRRVTPWPRLGGPAACGRASCPVCDRRVA